MPRLTVTPAFLGLALVAGILAGRNLSGQEFVRDTPEFPEVTGDPESLLAAAEALRNVSLDPDPMPLLWVLAGALGVALVYALSIVAHELGHYLTARRLGVEVDGITLNGWGGLVELVDDARLTRGRFALIIAAGPLVTALIVASAYLLYRVETPYSPAGAAADAVIDYALIVNAAVLVFNLLPLPGLDGGQLLRAGRATRA